MSKYNVVESSSYRKDYKRLKRQGKDMSRLRSVINLLADGEALPAEYKDHPLKGQYKGYRDCHIEDDWVLIYKIENKILTLSLTRTGTHSDLY